MYLNSSLTNYEKKYKKYKIKYQVLKSQLSGAKGTLLPPFTKVPLAKVPSVNGGNCEPLPNPEEEDDFSTNNLLDLCPDERITIQNKCYKVSALYTWIITDNNNILPSTQTVITSADKQRLIQAYEELPKVFVPNILTRQKLIELFPSFLYNTMFDLSTRGFTGITIDTFTRGALDNNLSLLRLDLQNNQIRELQSGVFDNLPRLQYLYLNDNHIQKLQSGIFNNLSNLKYLWLDYNQIRELQPGIFDNLPRLNKLNLDNNQIQELQPGIFDNLQNLNELSLINNQIQELSPGIFNSLSELNKLFLGNNQIRELPPDIFNNLRNLYVLYLNNNQITELQVGIFNNLSRLRYLGLNHNQIRELQPNSYYGLSESIRLDI